MDFEKTANEIFLAYDIRGIYGKTITKEVAERIGGAVAQYAPYSSICIGYDGRFSSPELQDAFLKGLKKYGADVKVNLLGMVPTGVTYLTTWKEGYDLGVSITASHNPPEFNGFKFAKRDGLSFGDLQGLKKVFLSLKPAKDGNVITKQDTGAIKRYAEFYHSKFPNLSLFGKKIVTESYHGITSVLMPWFFSNFEAEVVATHADVRGDFNGLNPEPKPDTMVALSKEVVETNADMGVAFDGDGDRCGFVDDLGRVIPASKVAVLFARQALKLHPGAKVLANVECSSLIMQEVEKLGGKIVWTPVGHTIMEEIMMKEHAMLAVEPSLHYFFADLFPFSDGVASALKMSQLIVENGKLSKLVDSVSTYPMKRVGFSFNTHQEKEDKMKKIEAKLTKEYDCNLIDGLKIFLNDSDWVLIRKSNTEPLIRLTVEAKTQALLDKLIQEFSEKFTLI